MLRALYRAGDRLRHRARLRSGDQAHAWGKRGEDLAHRYLQARGYLVIARNYTTLNGSAEVDLVAQCGDTIVFVEVKTRATSEFGDPDRAVDKEKRRRIQRAAHDYLRRSGRDDAKIRFDIINVLFADGEKVEHIEDAFSRELSY